MWRNKCHTGQEKAGLHRYIRGLWNIQSNGLSLYDLITYGSIEGGRERREKREEREKREKQGNTYMCKCKGRRKMRRRERRKEEGVLYNNNILTNNSHSSIHVIGFCVPVLQ